MFQCGLRQNDASQFTGARNHSGGEAASGQLGSSGAQSLSPRHASVTLLALRTRVPRETLISVPLALRGCPGQLHPYNGGIWVPLARNARVRQVPTGRRVAMHRHERDHQL